MPLAYISYSWGDLRAFRGIDPQEWGDVALTQTAARPTLGLLRRGGLSEDFQPRILGYTCGPNSRTTFRKEEPMKKVTISLAAGLLIALAAGPTWAQLCRTTDGHVIGQELFVAGQISLNADCSVTGRGSLEVVFRSAAEGIARGVIIANNPADRSFTAGLIQGPFGTVFSGRADTPGGLLGAIPFGADGTATISFSGSINIVVFANVPPPEAPR